MVFISRFPLILMNSAVVFVFELCVRERRRVSRRVSTQLFHCLPMYRGRPRVAALCFPPPTCNGDSYGSMSMFASCLAFASALTLSYMGLLHPLHLYHLAMRCDTTRCDACTV